MIFNSFEFGLLFAISLFLYYLLKPKFRKPLLLLASAVFIGFNHWGFLALALSTSLMSYGAGIWIDGCEEEKKRQRAFVVSLVGHLMLLAGFKYFGFLAGNASFVMQLLGVQWDPIVTNVFLPLGISFYVFQSISYLIEVYWEEQEAECNIIDFLCYMLFFMKFLSGPIERPQDFLPQMKREVDFDYERVMGGVMLMIVGFFKKLVIADRLAPALNDVFSSVNDFSGAQLVVATLLYPMQLYADFSGYTDIAIGGAAILGIKLSPNFDRPFIAKSITDFWRRWHMSLSFWVRDYIYEPIAAQKRYWGVWGIVYALMVTFILLGLWHGGSWNFVIYGAIQGVIISYELMCGSMRSKWEKRFPKVFSVYSVLRTYILFSISLLFFRIEKFPDVMSVLSRLNQGILTSWKELNLGVRDHDIVVLVSALVVMFFYEYRMSRGDVWKQLRQQKGWIRWSFYYLIIIVIFIYGECGAKDFIYFQF